MDCRRHDDGILLRNKCLAQDTTAVDSTAVAPAVAEAVALREAAPDTVGDLVLGLKHCMDVIGSSPCVLYAARFCFGGSRFYPVKEYSQYFDEELC